MFCDLVLHQHPDFVHLLIRPKLPRLSFIIAPHSVLGKVNTLTCNMVTFPIIASDEGSPTKIGVRMSDQTRFLGLKARRRIVTMRSKELSHFKWEQS